MIRNSKQFKTAMVKLLRKLSKFHFAYKKVYQTNVTMYKI